MAGLIGRRGCVGCKMPTCLVEGPNGFRVWGLGFRVLGLGAEAVWMRDFSLSIDMQASGHGSDSHVSRPARVDQSSCYTIPYCLLKVKKLKDWRPAMLQTEPRKG